jgi:hypothetical protein
MRLGPDFVDNEGQKTMGNYNPSTIRKLLSQAFSDEDFGFFCYDNFREVYDKFTAGMSATTKIQELIVYCEKTNSFERMLQLVKEANPAKYAEFEPQLGEVASPPAASIAPTSTASPVAAVEVSEPESQPVGQDVFISYSTKNLDFVKALYQYLTRRGFSVWFDKQSIEGATQWRESIVTGIIGCKVFLLVLSPNSVGSDNVRKEVDLAEHHKKKILPLMWLDTPLPPSFQYQLAGIQYVTFNGVDSEENFNRVAGIVGKLLGGSSVSEAAVGERAIQAAGITDTAAQPAQPSSGRPERGRGRGTAQEVSAFAAGVGVMTKVVTRISAFTAEEQDEINEELKWLFTATDHFLKVQAGQVNRTTPVPVSIPPKANLITGANNMVLSSLSDFDLQLLKSQVPSVIKQIDTYTRNLAFELDKEAQLGGQAGSNIALMNSIKAQQKGIAERTQELAKLMQQIYGVLVYAPEDMLKQFG